MIRRMILIVILLGLTACMAAETRCGDGQDGGIGGTGACFAAPQSVAE